MSTTVTQPTSGGTPRFHHSAALRRAENIAPPAGRAATAFEMHAIDGRSRRRNRRRFAIARTLWAIAISANRITPKPPVLTPEQWLDGEFIYDAWLSDSLLTGHVEKVNAGTEVDPLRCSSERRRLRAKSCAGMRGVVSELAAILIGYRSARTAPQRG